jgi:hypothetical protein
MFLELTTAFIQITKHFMFYFQPVFYVLVMFIYSGFSIHDVSVTDLIRNCELPEDGAGLAPKHVGAAITF